MCIVSNIGDGYREAFPHRWPMIPLPYAEPKEKPEPIDWKLVIDLSKYVTKREFEDLKKELEALKKVITEAQKFDAATSQPNCDSPDKFALVQWLAKALGVDLSDLKLNK